MWSSIALLSLLPLYFFCSQAQNLPSTCKYFIWWFFCTWCSHPHFRYWHISEIADVYTYWPVRTYLLTWSIVLDLWSDSWGSSTQEYFISPCSSVGCSPCWELFENTDMIFDSGCISCDESDFNLWCFRAPLGVLDLNLWIY